MSGNVFERCSDWYNGKYYDEYIDSVIENPLGPETGWRRVLRGGSWPSNTQYCRSAYRYNSFPDYRDSSIGFRLVFGPVVSWCHLPYP